MGGHTIQPGECKRPTKQEATRVHGACYLHHTISSTRHLYELLTALAKKPRISGLSKQQTEEKGVSFQMEQRKRRARRLLHLHQGRGGVPGCIRMVYRKR